MLYLRKPIKKVDDALLRINVWISYNGLIETAYKDVPFPYKAISPRTNRKKVFKNIDDIYNEIVKLYEIAEEEGFSIGKALYSQCAFFCDYSLLLSLKHQNRIKEYNYCKAFSCSPYPSMMETPANMIDDFMTIEQEVNQCIQAKQKEANNA